MVYAKVPSAQIAGVLGPRQYPLNGLWYLNPCYLGPWTRVLRRGTRSGFRGFKTVGLGGLGFDLNPKGPKDPIIRYLGFG